MARNEKLIGMFLHFLLLVTKQHLRMKRREKKNSNNTAASLT